MDSFSNSLRIAGTDPAPGFFVSAQNVVRGDDVFCFQNLGDGALRCAVFFRCSRGWHRRIELRLRRPARSFDRLSRSPASISSSESESGISARSLTICGAMFSPGFCRRTSRRPPPSACAAISSFRRAGSSPMVDGARDAMRNGSLRSGMVLLASASTRSRTGQRQARRPK